MNARQIQPDSIMAAIALLMMIDTAAVDEMARASSMKGQKQAVLDDKLMKV